MPAATADEPRRVLDFWFGPAVRGQPLQSRTEWFRKDDRFDAAIRVDFGALIEQALHGELERWAEAPESALAQIIVLDQFTRNAFRDTPRAFAGDPRALAAAVAFVGAGQDLALKPLQRVFAYLPFEHAESMAMQHKAVRLLTGLAADAPETAGFLDFANRHLVVIERFGRFPHRNTTLGRMSTAEETEFLKEPGSRF